MAVIGLVMTALSGQVADQMHICGRKIRAILNDVERTAKIQVKLHITALHHMAK